jgi:hypothetical protein
LVGVLTINGAKIIFVQSTKNGHTYVHAGQYAKVLAATGGNAKSRIIDPIHKRLAHMVDATLQMKMNISAKGTIGYICQSKSWYFQWHPHVLSCILPPKPTRNTSDDRHAALDEGKDMVYHLRMELLPDTDHHAIPPTTLLNIISNTTCNTDHDLPLPYGTQLFTSQLTSIISDSPHRKRRTLSSSPSSPSPSSSSSSLSSSSFHSVTVDASASSPRKKSRWIPSSSTSSLVSSPTPTTPTTPTTTTMVYRSSTPTLYPVSPISPVSPNSDSDGVDAVPSPAAVQPDTNVNHAQWFNW